MSAIQEWSSSLSTFVAESTAIFLAGRTVPTACLERMMSAPPSDPDCGRHRTTTPGIHVGPQSVSQGRRGGDAGAAVCLCTASSVHREDAHWMVWRHLLDDPAMHSSRHHH